MSKQTLILKRFFLVLFMFFIDFHVKAKIDDFVKNSVFPRENHVFWSSEFPGGNAFLNSQPFEKIRFGVQNPGKIAVKIH